MYKIKTEKGLGAIGVILIILLIAGVIFVGYKVLMNIKNQSEVENIESDMLLIQGACKVRKQKSIAKSDDSQIIGKKISEITDDKIIDIFKNTGNLKNDEMDKFYRLTDDDLKSLEIEVKNLPNSYYLVNYDTQEIIITASYKGKYRLSEILKKDTNENEISVKENSTNENTTKTETENSQNAEN